MLNLTCRWRQWGSAACRPLSLQTACVSGSPWRRCSWSPCELCPFSWKCILIIFNRHCFSGLFFVCVLSCSSRPTWSWAGAASRAEARRRDWILRPGQRTAGPRARPACRGSPSHEGSCWLWGWSAQKEPRTGLKAGTKFKPKVLPCCTHSKAAVWTLTSLSAVPPSLKILNGLGLNDFHVLSKTGDVQTGLEHLLLLQKNLQKSERKLASYFYSIWLSSTSTFLIYRIQGALTGFGTS